VQIHLLHRMDFKVAVIEGCFSQLLGHFQFTPLSKFVELNRIDFWHQNFIEPLQKKKKKVFGKIPVFCDVHSQSIIMSEATVLEQ